MINKDFSHLDDTSYFKYTFKNQLDKFTNTLEGIIKGIAIDQKINEKEVAELRAWCDDYRFIQNRHPFNEVIPLIEQALLDNYLSKEEIDDIIWLCNNLQSDNQYFSAVTASIQVLEGILHGIMADNVITKDELIRLVNWMDDNLFLKGCYPYDELESLIVTVLRDGNIDEQEQKLLKSFFSEFISLPTASNINVGEIANFKKELTVTGICSICPDIEFPDRVFCFTGASSKATRSQIAQLIEERGGKFHDSIIQKLNYLVVGANGNPCWAFACYGRKIEKTIDLRKQGYPIVIVHECDFWDAVGS